MATATPTKLRSGEWGARVEGSVRTGDTITIRTKAGKMWDARVERVVWTDGAVSIVATASAPRRSYGRRSYSAGECCGYPCPVTGRRCTPSDPCHDCQ